MLARVLAFRLLIKIKKKEFKVILDLEANISLIR